MAPTASNLPCIAELGVIGGRRSFYTSSTWRCVLRDQKKADISFPMSRYPLRPCSFLNLFALLNASSEFLGSLLTIFDFASELYATYSRVVHPSLDLLVLSWSQRQGHVGR